MMIHLAIEGRFVAVVLCHYGRVLCRSKEVLARLDIEREVFWGATCG